MKYMICVMALVLMSTASMAKECDELYRGMLKGDSASLKSYIVAGCASEKDPPYEDLRRYLQEFTKKEVAPASLNCMGDVKSEKSPEKGADYYVLAADLGDVNSENSLGVLYRDGRLDNYYRIPRETLESYSKRHDGEFTFDALSERLETSPYAPKAERESSDKWLHQHRKAIEAYSDRCIASLSSDYKTLFLRLEKMRVELMLGNGQSENYQAWVSMQGMIMGQLVTDLGDANAYFRNLNGTLGFEVKTAPVDEEALRYQAQMEVQNQQAAQGR